MNEQLVVKNFGPIKDATVDFKRVTVFIGPTGGGKSTLAKLAAVFHEPAKLGQEVDNRNSLEFYQIDSFPRPHAEVVWTFNGLQLILKGHQLILDRSFNNRIDQEIVAAHRKLAQQGNFPSLEDLKRGAFPSSSPDSAVAATYHTILSQLVRAAHQAVLPNTQVHYIPAERVYAPAITGALAAMMRDNFNLPKPLLEFINQFVTARYEVKELPVDFLKIKYQLRGDEDFILHQTNKTKLLLNETASGIQSVTPLLVLLEHLSRNTEQAQSFIIEEPELNLYPTAQQGLLNWLVEKCTKGENDLTITTHSPYILSHLNLLLYAYQVGNKDEEKRAKVAAIIPEECWLNPDEFAAYYVNGPEGKNGVRSLIDVETKLISQNGLDTVSGIQADQFDQLLDINSGF